MSAVVRPTAAVASTQRLQGDLDIAGSSGNDLAMDQISPLAA